MTASAITQPSIPFIPIGSVGGAVQPELPFEVEPVNNFIEGHGLITALHYAATKDIDPSHAHGVAVLHGILRDAVPTIDRERAALAFTQMVAAVTADDFAALDTIADALLYGTRTAFSASLTGLATGMFVDA